MLTIAQVENALFQLLAPVASSIATKLEILPPDYFESTGEREAMRNRHAFIAFESKEYNEPANKGLTGSYAQQVRWNMKIVCANRELRTHQQLYILTDTLEQALAGVKVSTNCGPIYITSVRFRRLEENTIWLADVNFSFTESFSNCSNNRGFLIQ